MHPLSIPELAREANADEGFVRRLIEIGALPPQGPDAYGAREVRRVRLLRAWESAGLPADAIMRMVDAGALSLAFLDTPVVAGVEHLERSYEELCAEQNVPLSVIQRIHEALGFTPPSANDRARVDDPTLASVVQMFVGVGASETSTLRLLRVYADSLRRLAQAEVELYEAEIEGRLRGAGMDERQLMEFGTSFGDRINAVLEGALIAIYRRHREHIWIEHSTNHAEVALEQAGLHERQPRPHTICFVDLTGYTRITEERGDEVAARFAGELSSLVEDISFRRGGRPIRWLGDGGMFHFKEPQAAVAAGLDMVEGAPARGLPPTHIGIHTGPVVFQDGDVYGRTVNLAARIAGHAGPGQVLVSDETADAAGDGDLRFKPVGSVELKNVAHPVALFEAARESER
jgi:adenylate cyclase